MKLLILTLLLNLIALYTVCAQKRMPPEPITTIVPPVPTEPHNSTTSSTTTSSTTVTTSTTNPTTVPTTVAPSSPTTSATTSSTTTSTTTPAPSTSPTTPGTSTSTTAVPTPEPPKPVPRTWSVNTTGDDACILLKMEAILNVNYTNNLNVTQESIMNIPPNAISSGSCGDEKTNQQSIKLTWWFVDPNLTNSLEFLFSKNNSNFELDAVNVILSLDGQHFPNAKDANKTLALLNKKVNFITPEKMSYKCDKVELSLNMTNTNLTDGTIKLTEFQFQAFGNITHQQFAKARDCEPYETPDIVPIAVGCALMALIIIVLIGYLIGRRRNQARGYLSMIEE